MSNVLLADPTSAQGQAAIMSGPGSALAGACTGNAKALMVGLHTEAARADLAAARPPRDLHQQGSGRNAGEGAGGPRRGERSSWIDAFYGPGARQLRAGPDVAGLRDGFKLLDAEDSKRIIRRKMRLAEAAPALWR